MEKKQWDNPILTKYSRESIDILNGKATGIETTPNEAGSN